jgi:carbon-monoxide dehydrogenase medium subunit
MYEFKYHRPATVRQAANLLVKNEDAKVIAGGHTLLPVMKQRLASPPHLVDLSHIEGLDGIEMKGRSLVIGATATHNAVATSAIVGEAIPALAELAGLIGDPAVRHKGTIGGSLANNDPTADYPAACMALGATNVTNKRRLKPRISSGLFTTALESDDHHQVMFPLPKKVATSSSAPGLALLRRSVFVASVRRMSASPSPAPVPEACSASPRSRKP